MMNSIMKSLLVGAALTVIPSMAITQEKDLSKLGQQEFNSNCALCHGQTGRGNGPMLEYFAEGGYVNKNFPDLTLLSKKNKGVFPYKRVYKLIDGREQIKAHGPREMPVWGDEYNKNAIKYYMDWPKAWDTEAFIRTRILALIEYMSSIQAE